MYAGREKKEGRPVRVCVCGGGGGVSDVLGGESSIL